MKPKFKEFIKAVELECKKAKRSYDLANESALEIAKTSLTSHSQAGDRFHSQGTADLTKQRYESVLALKKEIEDKGEAIYFKVNSEELFLVDNPVLISGFKIVSTKSPLGLKLINEK